VLPDPGPSFIGADVDANPAPVGPPPGASVEEWDAARARITRNERVIVRRGRGQWWIETSVEGSRIGLECGPFLTRFGARMHRKLWT
jgi:hypothetical protein